MKFLILFLISFSSFAGYMSKPDIESCDFNRTFYLKHSHCELLEGAKCYLVPSGYDCKYSMKKDSKSEVESCSSDEDCQSKLKSKTCSDPKESAVKVISDPKEVYCTKEFIGIDSAKKASHDLDEAARKSAKDAKRVSRDSLKLKLEAGFDLTREELMELLLNLL